MHPEMLPSLVAERHRAVATSMNAHRPPARSGRTGPPPAGPARRDRGAGRRRPFLRVSWSRVTLAAQAGATGRGRSWVIVISATRPL